MIPWAAIGTAASGIGSLMGGVSSLMGGSGDGNKDARRMLTFQQGMQRQNLLENPWYQVEGLKKAGLNPALAYGGFGGPTVNSAAPNASYAPDYENNRVNSAREGMLAIAQVAKLKADTAASESVADLNKATAVRTGVQTQIDASNAGLASINLDRETYLRDMYGSFDVEGRKLSANDFENLYRKELSARHLLSTSHMDKIANDHGFPNFVTAAKSIEFRKAFQDLVLQQYSMPKASAEHDFYLTTFGKSIAPYLNSAESISRTVKPFSR